MNGRQPAILAEAAQQILAVVDGAQHRLGGLLRQAGHEEDVQALGADVQGVGHGAFHRLIAVGLAEGVAHRRDRGFPATPPA